MAMFDINGEEFFVGDTLKVIKSSLAFRAGDVVVCIYDDGTDHCKFCEVGEDPEEDARWMTNSYLQKA